MDRFMRQTFQHKTLPNGAKWVGYSWLINHFELNVPLREYSLISEKRLTSQHVQKEEYTIFDAQYNVTNTPYANLEFAIKHEVLDLLVLKSILKRFAQSVMIESIKVNPKRILNKKIWFYYEFLLDKKLPIEDLSVGKYDNLLNEKRYITKNHPLKSKRHKINYNLLGTASLCPIVLRTDKLEQYMNAHLKTDISTTINKVSKSLMRRASSFLLLADSKASFEIEGERVTRNRIESWGKIINEAGKKVLSLEEIERLHGILLEDSRFVKIGLREDEVFLGDRDRENIPMPEFIGARSKDLKKLLEAWIELDSILTDDKVDPVLHAVIMAFSFVYIHPLEDGNGRIHRYLLHHILAQRDFYPKGLIFPLSSIILDEIENYREVLVAHSSSLMSMIEWEATVKGNVKIVNDTSDLYRFFNITESCEFIYRLVEKTIKETLPNELDYLKAFDGASSAINDVVTMPDNMVKMLITFLLQNDGKLSKKKKEKYFEALEKDELEAIEFIIGEYFEGIENF